MVGFQFPTPDAHWCALFAAKLYLIFFAQAGESDGLPEKNISNYSFFSL